ncbi:MAG TPA: MFS transporter [Planctomycetaceae bacterium]|nr:MFS transporter [Planctomycetaceae bacterium]
MTRARQASLLVIFVTVFIDLLGFGIVLPLLPRYGRHFDAGPLVLGLLLSSFSAMQFLFAPLWGRLSDRIGRRPVLMIGLAGSTVCYGLFGVATSLGREGTLLGLGALVWLFITRIGAGIAGATIPTAQAYIADITSPAERGKGMALIGAAFGIGFTFGPLLGAAFVSGDPDAPPSPYPGYVAAALSGLAFLSAVFVLPESLRPESQRAVRRWLDVAALRRAGSQRGLALVLLAIFLTTFCFAQFESTLALLTRELGLADRANFFVFAYVGFVLTLSQGLLVRRLMPRLREFRMSVAGAVVMSGGLALIALAAGARSLWGLYAVLPLAVIGFSALTPSLQSLLSLRTAADEQGEMLGLGQSMAALARILGPLAGMPLFDIGMTWPYWTAAGLMALGLVLVAAAGSADRAAALDDVQPVET